MIFTASIFEKEQHWQNPVFSFNMDIDRLQKITQQFDRRIAFFSEKHQELIREIQGFRKSSIENFIACLAYLDFKEEFEDWFRLSNLPIVFYEPQNFIPQFNGLKNILSQSDAVISKNDSLTENTKAFFGEGSSTLTQQIMVNLQQEAEHDLPYLSKLMDHGVYHFRLNCAFGDKQFWKQVHQNLEHISTQKKQPANLLFDLAGPKIRVEKLFENNKEVKTIRLIQGENIEICTSGAIRNSDLKTISCNFSGDFESCRTGEIVRLDDSRFEAIIEKTGKERILVNMAKVGPSQSELSIGKGINFQQSDLGISGLTAKDRNDLASVVHLEGILCFSFVRTARDVANIKKEIEKHRPASMPIVIKIETFQAIQNLAEIILAAMRFPKVAILIARGDLVSECGWMALPEIQFQIEKYARAAHLPIILATEILESFNQTGQHTRPEMIDLHVAQNYDCILLNKGENLFEVIELVSG